MASLQGACAPGAGLLRDLAPPRKGRVNPKNPTQHDGEDRGQLAVAGSALRLTGSPPRGGACEYAGQSIHRVKPGRKVEGRRRNRAMADRPSERNERATGSFRSSTARLCGDVRAVTRLRQRKPGARPAEGIVGRALEGTIRANCETGKIRGSPEKTGGFT